jgi:hypothetical protein
MFPGLEGSQAVPVNLSGKDRGEGQAFVSGCY